MLAAVAAAVAFALGVLVGAEIVGPAWTRYRSRERAVKSINTVTIVVSRRLLVAAIVVIIAGFVALGLVGVSLVVQRAGFLDAKTNFNGYVACEAQYNTDFHATYEARSHAAGKVSKAMDHIVKAVKDRNPRALSAGVDHYVALRIKQQAAKASHPIPEPPDTVCGPVPKGN